MLAEDDWPRDEVMRCFGARATTPNNQRDRRGGKPRVLHAATLTCGVLVLGCRNDVADVDRAFYAGGDRPVHCAVDLDTTARNDLESYDAGLDRAAANNEIVEIYGHQPGKTCRSIGSSTSSPARATAASRSSRTRISPRAPRAAPASRCPSTTARCTCGLPRDRSCSSTARA